MKKSADGISVILPNYNHGRYVRRAVDSILQQEGLREIIIVDDGSTDDSPRILEEIAHASPLIRLLRNPVNQGLVAAQNRALAEATGRYVHLAAADDMALSGFYRRATDMLEQFPQAGLFTGNSLLIEGSTGRFLSVRPIVMPKAAPGYLPPAEVQTALRHADNWILTGASIIRADLVKACGGLDETLGTFADGYLTRKIAVTQGYCYAPTAVATWSIFPASASRSVALNAGKAKALRETARARVAADPAFPPDYADRCTERMQFFAARLALHDESADISTVAALGGKNAVDRALLTGIMALSRGFAGRLASSAWLYARFRPLRLRDLLKTYIRRTLSRRARADMRQALREVDDRNARAV